MKWICDCVDWLVDWSLHQTQSGSLSTVTTEPSYLRTFLFRKCKISTKTWFDIFKTFQNITKTWEKFQRGKNHGNRYPKINQSINRSIDRSQMLHYTTPLRRQFQIYGDKQINLQSKIPIPRTSYHNNWPARGREGKIPRRKQSADTSG